MVLSLGKGHQSCALTEEATDLALPAGDMKAGFSARLQSSVCGFCARTAFICSFIHSFKYSLERTVFSRISCPTCSSVSNGTVRFCQELRSNSIVLHLARPMVCLQPKEHSSSDAVWLPMLAQKRPSRSHLVLWGLVL